VKDCLPCERPHAGPIEQHEEEEAAEKKCYELTEIPVPPFPCTDHSRRR